MSQEKQDFVSRWQKSDGAERANYQLFLSELCDFLGVERPEPSQGIEDFNTYVFDTSIEIRNPDGTISRGFIDLYKKKPSFSKQSKAANHSPCKSMPTTT